MLEKLSSILVQETLLPVNEKGMLGPELIIKEDDPNARLDKVVICGLTCSFVAVKHDYFAEVFPYFKKSEGMVHRACDGIVLLLIEGVLYVLLCELKSTKPKRKRKYEPKMLNSYIFVQYLLATMKMLYGYSVEKVRFLNILFTDARDQKQGTGIGCCAQTFFEEKFDDRLNGPCLHVPLIQNNIHINLLLTRLHKSI